MMSHLYVLIVWVHDRPFLASVVVLNSITGLFWVLCTAVFAVRKFWLLNKFWEKWIVDNAARYISRVYWQIVITAYLFQIVTAVFYMYMTANSSFLYVYDSQFYHLILFS